MTIDTSITSSDSNSPITTSVSSLCVQTPEYEKEAKQHMRTYVTGTLEAFLKAAFGNTLIKEESPLVGTQSKDALLGSWNNFLELGNKDESDKRASPFPPKDD